MFDFHISRTENTPDLLLDTDSGTFAITGSSYPNNSLDFYKEHLEKVLDYAKKSSGLTKIIIQLEYFNTSSAKMFVDFLLEIRKLNKDAISVIWYHEKEDIEMIEVAEGFQEITGLNFQLEIIK